MVGSGGPEIGTPLNVKAPGDAYEQVIDEAEQALEARGFTVMGYGIHFLGDEMWYMERDPHAAIEQFQEDLNEQMILRLTLEEPVDDEHQELLYHTRIIYQSNADSGYFTVDTDRYRPEVSADDADRWAAQIERALLDADFPVMLGDLNHKDNVPVTSDQFYGEYFGKLL